MFEHSPASSVVVCPNRRASDSEWPQRACCSLPWWGLELYPICLRDVDRLASLLSWDSSPNFNSTRPRWSISMHVEWSRFWKARDVDHLYTVETQCFHAFTRRDLATEDSWLFGLLSYQLQVVKPRSVTCQPRFFAIQCMVLYTCRMRSRLSDLGQQSLRPGSISEANVAMVTNLSSELPRKRFLLAFQSRCSSPSTGYVFRFGWFHHLTASRR